MAPRRGSGGSSSSYDSYYSSPWSQEISLSLDYVPSKTSFIAGFAFDVLTILALVSFLIWACLIHNGRGQLKGVIPALSLYLTSMIAGLVYSIFFLADATVMMYYVIDLMLNEFFYLAAGCAIIFVFYHLIHSLLDRLTDAGKPYAAVSIIHWVILGLVSVVSLATFGLYVAVQVQYVQSSYGTKMLDSYNKLESARAIIWWVLSLEIVAWFIFIVIKAGSHRFTSKLPIFSLLGGSIAWLALTLTWAVVYIIYALGTAAAPTYLNCVQSVLQFIFLVATFVGILLACSNWRSVDDRADKNGPQYPYSQTQYQPYPTYQQQHPAELQQPYQQQYYQQPYPQPTQQGYQQPVAQHGQPEQVRQD